MKTTFSKMSNTMRARLRAPLWIPAVNSAQLDLIPQSRKARAVRESARIPGGKNNGSASKNGSAHAELPRNGRHQLADQSFRIDWQQVPPARNGSTNGKANATGGIKDSSKVKPAEQPGSPKPYEKKPWPAAKPLQDTSSVEKKEDSRSTAQGGLADLRPGRTGILPPARKSRQEPSASTPQQPELPPTRKIEPGSTPGDQLPGGHTASSRFRSYQTGPAAQPRITPRFPQPGQASQARGPAGEPSPSSTSGAGSLGQNPRNGGASQLPPRAEPTSGDQPAQPVQGGQGRHLSQLGRKPGPEKAVLERVFSENPDVPSQVGLLGIHQDGLPVLLDLFDPSPGALLIVGDEREAQLDVLRTLVASTALRISPRGVQFQFITCQPDAWKDWIADRGFERYVLGIEDVSGKSLNEAVLRAGDWTEQRRLGQSSGPPVLLIMDTLSFLPRLDYDIRLNFDWMLKEGPFAAIWPVAAISSDLASSLGSRMLRGFQSRIFGYADDPAVYSRLAGLDLAQAQQFGQPGTFAVQVGENWLRFKLPQ